MSHFFTRVGAAYRKRQDYRRTLAEVNAMSDAEALDLGLNRTDFPALAAQAVYGK